MQALKILLRSVLTCCLFLFCAGATAQKLRPIPINNPEWSKPYEPFRIAGNLYYVGTYDLGCYLITTPEGNILINTGLAASLPVIKKHIEKLGFKFKDIKILLTTQAHYDHVGAMADVKKMTGAKMMADAADAPVLADGGNSDFVMGGKGSLFKPINADRLLHDKDVISLGGMNITILHHPGHTQGSCSYLFDVKDTKRSYKVLIANLPSVLPDTKLSGMPGYANVGKDYAYTFEAMPKLQFDLFLASHASQFGLHDKRKPGDAYNPRIFADRALYDSKLEALHKDYLERLAGK